MNHFKILGLNLLLLVMLSCGKSELSPKDYIEWCDDAENGLVKVFSQNNNQLTCQYTSSSYAVLKQNDPSNLDASELDENVELVSDLIQFKLTFENKESANFIRNNYTSPEEFNTRSMYLAYGLREDLKLVTGVDTVICNMNHHERTYGNTPYETVLITFPKINDESVNLELIFDDRVFGFGRVKFFFDENDLVKIPELII